MQIKRTNLGNSENEWIRRASNNDNIIIDNNKNNNKKRWSEIERRFSLCGNGSR